MRHAIFWGWGGLAAFVSLTLAGCSPPPRTVEVIGSVTYEGRPVAGALVVFISDYRDDPPAHGVTDADGHYHLNTFFASHDIPRGAVPGRHYTIFIEKFSGCDGTIVCQKMAEIAAAGGDVPGYLRERAIYDLWPGGVPEDWPLDYIPIMGIPRRLQKDEQALSKITRLQKGLPMLPGKYGDTATSELEATVEVSHEAQVFDFNLSGPIEEVKIRGSDSASPPNQETRPLKEAHRSDGPPISSKDAFWRGTISGCRLASFFRNWLPA